MKISGATRTRAEYPTVDRSALALRVGAWGALLGKLPGALPLVVAVFGWMSPAYGASAVAVAKVREANAAYAAGDYPAALEAYEEAEVDCPECPEIAYNQALAHYRLRDFTRARELFNEALSTRDLDLEARVKFNLGNVAYAQALEKLSDLPEAIENARRAITHYRDALDLDPEDVDARANIEIAQLLIKDLLDRQKQQQEQQQNQDQQQDQQCDNPQEQQQGQDQDQQGEDQQDQAGDEDQEQQQEPQADGEQQEQETQQPQGEQEQSAAEQQEAREMTQEEAERLLQAVRDKEAKRREELARRRRARSVPVSRDW